MPSTRPKSVRFERHPVSSVSRPLANVEAWTIDRILDPEYLCKYCLGRRFCPAGTRLLDEIRQHIYLGRDGTAYSTTSREQTPVRVEVPRYAWAVPDMLSCSSEVASRGRDRRN